MRNVEEEEEVACLEAQCDILAQKSVRKLRFGILVITADCAHLPNANLLSSIRLYAPNDVQSLLIQSRNLCFGFASKNPCQLNFNTAAYSLEILAPPISPATVTSSPGVCLLLSSTSIGYVCEIVGDVRVVQHHIDCTVRAYYIWYLHRGTIPFATHHRIISTSLRLHLMHLESLDATSAYHDFLQE